MILGPLEYLVVVFEGNRFTGHILPELRAAQESGIIHILDLFFLKKDEDGTLTATALRDLQSEDAAPFAPLAEQLLDLLTPEDIEQVGSTLPNNSSAALLLFEHTWAIGLKQAIQDANGMAVAGGLVAPQVLRLLEEELSSAQQDSQQETVATKATE